MQMRPLGRTGIQVSALALGSMTFGGIGAFRKIGALGQREADALVGRALEAGINFFDTADSYSAGFAEQLLGRALGARRQKILLATKVGGRVSADPGAAGLSRRHILEACHDSLDRLGTDYIDLYQVHYFDPATPLEETLQALDELVDQGKVRFIGCSNFAAWQLMKALAMAEKHGWHQFVSLQAYYSLIARELENELVPLCLDQGLGIVVWSPLAGGFLSGKYRRGLPAPAGTRLSNSQGGFLEQDEARGFRGNFAVIEELERIAAEHQATMAQAALNYLLGKPGVTSVILGARTPEQLSDNLRAIHWHMTPEEVDRLDRLSRPPVLYPYWLLEHTRPEG